MAARRARGDAVDVGVGPARAVFAKSIARMRVNRTRMPDFVLSIATPCCIQSL